MRILIYKRTHVGDPNTMRQFGNEGCMGRIRAFAFDAVIGVGGISGLPELQGIAWKINWVGRNPIKTPCVLDPRGPLVSFKNNDFRLFEQHGPLLSALSPSLAKKVYESRARFFFLSLNADELKEARNVISSILDLKQFDHLQLPNTRSVGCYSMQALPNTALGKCCKRKKHCGPAGRSSIGKKHRKNGQPGRCSR